MLYYFQDPQEKYVGKLNDPRSCDQPRESAETRVRELQSAMSPLKIPFLANDRIYLQFVIMCNVYKSYMIFSLFFYFLKSGIKRASKSK